ncbi:MAG: L28 family ribosomal protein [Candidatus Carsonella ruddii]
MSNICILCKKKKVYKNKVSYSNIKNKFYSKINIKNISYWVNKYFAKIKISSKSIKIIKKCL